MIERPKSVAMLRVFEIQIEDGTERRHDTHALTGAQELPPGNYELVLRTDGALAGCKHPREQAATGPHEHSAAVFSQVHALQAQIDRKLATYLDDEEFDVESVALADAALERMNCSKVLPIACPRACARSGPTTDQVNHYCPDCRTAWTTWPARGTPEPVGINGLTEAETSATASVMGLPPYPRTEKRA